VDSAPHPAQALGQVDADLAGPSAQSMLGGVSDQLGDDDPR